MKTVRAGALIFGAVILGGCAASSVQGAQVRVHTTTTFEPYVPSQEAVAQASSKSARRESPPARACKGGDSKACNELGDRLTLRHAYAGALQWYETSCGRVRSAMVPTAARLLQLSQELAQLDRVQGDDEGAARKRMAPLKSDASEIRARIRGCLDAGEAMKADGQLKQSLAYFDAVCEFSALVEAAGEVLPGLEHISESGCAGGQAGRAELNGQTQFSPRLFADLLPQRPPAEAQRTAQPDEGMVFSEGDL
jgi:hypothetical protein